MAERRHRSWSETDPNDGRLYFAEGRGPPHAVGNPLPSVGSTILVQSGVERNYHRAAGPHDVCGLGLARAYRGDINTVPVRFRGGRNPYQRLIRSISPARGEEEQIAIAMPCEIRLF